MTDIVEFPERRRVEQEAADWLIRLDRSAKPSADDLTDLREWLSRSPVHREELGSLARLWGNMNALTELAVPLGSIGAPERTAFLARGGVGMRFALAGFAAMVIVSLSIFFVDPNPADSLTRTNGLYSTSVGEQKSVLLADGSEVVLNTNSQIEVNYSGQYRDMQLLRGEAHFIVTENEASPFRVYASNKLIEAIGTAFGVQLRGSDVRVAVSEGKVALTLHDRALAEASSLRNELVKELLGTLEAGEVGIIADDTDTDTDTDTGSGSSLRRIELANVERLLAWRGGVLAFSGESLETVVSEISRYTTVNIEISDPAVKAIRIGGQVPVGQTDAMLAALEDNFGLRVRRLSPDHVVLSAVAE
jgi:transmembrane sensor